VGEYGQIKSRHTSITQKGDSMYAKARQLVALTLIVCITGLALPQPAHAGMLATDEVISSSERQKVTEFLQRPEVRAQLEAYGVKPADAQARVAVLSDEEVAKVAGQVDQLPAGGSVLGVLLLVFVILLITDLLGLTKIFPFTKPIR
jgi:hypothetical protein